MCLTLITAKFKARKACFWHRDESFSLHRDYRSAIFIVSHQTFPEAMSNFPDLLSTLSLHLNQCWCYNRDLEWVYKAQETGRQCYRWPSAQSTLCMPETSSFPQFAVLACMQMQECNLKPVTKETKQVLPWVILSLEGVLVSFLWWKLQGWLIYFDIYFNTQGQKHWFQIKPYIPPTTLASKSRTESLWLQSGAAKDPSTLLREGAKRQKFLKEQVALPLS